jgi:dihydroorotate dehydrogenase (NAD+) catalytic subunit
MNKKINTQIKIGKLILKNPVMPASGTFGYGLEFEKFFDLSKLGAIITKGLSILPVKGNKPQRLVETPAGLLNSIGLQNIGIDNFINEKLPLLRNYKVPIIVNIYGRTLEEYLLIAKKLQNVRIEAIEINISCPNVKKGGMQFASDKNIIKKLLIKIKKIYSGTIIVKLSPNTGNIEEIAKLCEEYGADSVSLINTVTGMMIDIKKRKPVLGNVFGGLSGPAIKPIALAMVHKVYKKVKIPIIGIGGITDYRDALEFLIAGATAIQIGSANFRDPLVCINIIKDIENYMIENNIADINSIIGSLNY